MSFIIDPYRFGSGAPVYADPPSGSGIIRNTTTYDAFGVTYKKSGNLYHMFREGTSHLEDGVIKLEKSTDSGATWGTRTTIYNGATADDRNLGGGVLDTGTVLIGTQESDNSGGVLASLPLRSTDGETFSAGSDFPLAGGTDVIVPYGPLIDFGGGTAWVIGYILNTAWAIPTDDDGLTFGTPIALHSNATNGLVEPAVVRLNANEMLMVHRITGIAHLRAASSFDGGTTWIDLGEIPDTANGVSPWLSVLDDGRVLMTASYRSGTGTFKWSVADPDVALRWRKAWTTPSTIYTGAGGGGADFGYFSDVKLGAYWLGIGYDGTASDTDLVRARFDEPTAGSEPGMPTPLDLGDVQLWLDASDASTITDAGGGAVSQWTSKDISSKAFVQATAGLRPTTGASTQNGLNVIDFASDWLASNLSSSLWSFFHNGTSYTVFMVASVVGANPDKIVTLMSTNEIAGSSRGAHFFYDDRSSGSRNDQIRHFVSAGSPTFANVDNASANGALTTDAFHLIRFSGDPDNATAANRSTIEVDDGGDIKNNSTSNAVSTSAPVATLRIGTNPAGTQLGDLKIAEIIVFSRDLNLGERLAMEEYLADKWGITL